MAQLPSPHTLKPLDFRVMTCCQQNTFYHNISLNSHFTSCSKRNLAISYQQPNLMVVIFFSKCKDMGPLSFPKIFTNPPKASCNQIITLLTFHCRINDRPQSHSCPFPEYFGSWPHSTTAILGYFNNHVSCPKNILPSKFSDLLISSNLVLYPISVIYSVIIS